MNIIHSLILGAVEGITEFLPVSSTAHLIMASVLMKLPQSDFQKFFEVFIQSGAILAVLFLHLDYVIKHRDVIKKISLSFLPTAVIGFVLYKIIKDIFFESNTLIITALFTVGIFFLILEVLIAKKKIILKHTISRLTPLQAIGVGLAQALAVVPGVSRSGIVMMAMMLKGYKREEAALYSFLLAVPTIFLATVYDFYKMKHVLSQSVQYLPLLCIGFATSFIVAYGVMKWFIDFLKNNSLVYFGIYRIVLAIILMFII